MSVGQKLAMFKIRATRVTFLSLCNLEAAPEEAMQLRRLIKSSNESSSPYLFGKFEFWNFGKRLERIGKKMPLCLLIKLKNEEAKIHW